MKVLLIHEHGNTHGSGAVIAMYRLHRGLQGEGITSTLACRRRRIEPSITEIVGPGSKPLFLPNGTATVRAEPVGDQVAGRSRLRDRVVAPRRVVDPVVALRRRPSPPDRTSIADARRLAPAEPGGYVLAALLLRDAGEREQAIALLDEGVAAGVPGPTINEELCFLLISLDRHERAAGVARKALETYPDSAALQLAQGLALAAAPETRGQAAESLGRALEGEVPNRARHHHPLDR